MTIMESIIFLATVHEMKFSADRPMMHVPTETDKSLVSVGFLFWKNKLYTLEFVTKTLYHILFSC